MARASATLLKRRLDIAEIVRKKGEVKVDELSDLLNVSGVTIRQDLTYLEEQGYLKRSFGGAIYIAPENSLPKYKTVSEQLVEQNGCDVTDVELLNSCLDFINDGDTIFIGHDRLLKRLLPFLYSKKALTLVTNDLDVAILAKEVSFAKVVVIGGVLSFDHSTYDESIFNATLKQYPINLFLCEVLAINALDELLIESSILVDHYRVLLKKAERSMGIILQRTIQHEHNKLGKLEQMDIAVLSRAAITEYHQQLLDNQFSQINTDKFCMIYQNKKRS